MDQVDAAAPDDWRPVVAALANRDARAVWAQLIATGSADAGLSAARMRRALELLERVGLVRPSGDAYRADDAVLRRLLSTASTVRPQGVARFLRADGRIDRYPASAEDRHALLTQVADTALPPGEVVGERELTDRLASHADDPVALRRYLVDAGLVVRTPSGSEYARP